MLFVDLNGPSISQSNTLFWWSNTALDGPLINQSNRVFLSGYTIKHDTDHFSLFQETNDYLRCVCSCFVLSCNCIKFLTGLFSGVNSFKHRIIQCFNSCTYTFRESSFLCHMLKYLQAGVLDLNFEIRSPCFYAQPLQAPGYKRIGLHIVLYGQSNVTSK